MEGLVRFADVPAPPVKALQSTDEFGALWDFVADRPHQRVLEIGSAYGGTLWWWSWLPRITTLVSVDLPSRDPKVRPRALSARKQWSAWFAERMAMRFVEFRGTSHDPLLVGEVTDQVGPVDVLFIDGDHTPSGVRMDWELWSPLVRRGGTVAFHDSWSAGAGEEGVADLVAELRREAPSIEWTSPDGAGICALMF